MKDNMEKFLNNIKKVKFPREKTYTLKELQKILDSFDTQSKPTAQGLLRYIKGKK